MQPGIDSLPEEEPADVQGNKLQSDEVNFKQQQAFSPYSVIETKKTPEARRRLRTNDAAQEQIKYYQSHQSPFDPDNLKIKKFTNWIDVVASEKNLLANSIEAMQRTLDWLVESTRQENRLRQYWHNLKVAFNNYLAEIQQKN